MILSAANANGRAQNPDPPLFQTPRIFASVRTSGTDCHNEVVNTATYPEGLVVANLVGNDSKPDVAVVNPATWNVSVLRNTGTWKATPLGIPCGLEPIAGSPFSIEDHIPVRDIDAVDMDADLDLDLVLPVYSLITSAFRVAILKNNGGTFGTPEFIDLPADMNSAVAVLVDDFNVDGRKDVVVAGSKTSGTQQKARAVLLRGLATSGYATTVFDVSPTFPTSSGTSLTKGDIRQPTIPGRLDVVMGTDANKMLVLINDPPQGNNIFLPSEQDSVGTQGIAFGKFKGQQLYAELAVGNASAFDEWKVFHANAVGDFTSTAITDDYRLWDGTHDATNPWGVAVGYFNPDKKADVVVACSTGWPCNTGEPTHGGVAVFVGKGDVGGTFLAPGALFCTDPNSNASPKPRYVKVSDMNQDGFDDIVVTNTDDGTVCVLLNAYLASGGY
ncbi:MAG: hypothetical protein JNG88_14285 [Phycisphaerales bacterium]|nr:hypothetical protein [Phycisphaerales bacterium]